MTGGPFYGKYRGVVSANADPQRSGRIQAHVPDVLGDQPSGWATACVPCGTGQNVMPEIGARVWIEFEQGDPDYPIWTGCWWSDADAPPNPDPDGLPNPDPDEPPDTRPDAVPDTQEPSATTVVATEAGHTILIDETTDQGGITLTSASGARIAITEVGIVIDNGMGARITLIGPVVSVNNGALDVT